MKEWFEIIDSPYGDVVNKFLIIHIEDDEESFSEEYLILNNCSFWKSLFENQLPILRKEHQRIKEAKKQNINDFKWTDEQKQEREKSNSLETTGQDLNKMADQIDKIKNYQLEQSEWIKEKSQEYDDKIKEIHIYLNKIKDRMDLREKLKEFGL